MFLCLGGLTLADLMEGSYGTGEILVRPWMHTYNNVLSTIHLLIMLCLLVGVALADGFSRGNRIKALRWSAMVFLGVTALCFLTMLLFPHLANPGPWKHGSTEVATMRILVFLPLVTRDVGWGLLVMALFQPGNMPRWWVVILVGLVTLDLGLSVWKWATTPKAVIALFHPFITEPAYLIPWCVGGVLFLIMVRFKLARDLQ